MLHSKAEDKGGTSGRGQVYQILEGLRNRQLIFQWANVYETENTWPMDDGQDAAACKSLQEILQQ